MSQPRYGDGSGNGSGDSALVVLYDSRSCALTIRDLDGKLHDRVVEPDRTTPIDMTRETPSASWYVQNSGYPSQLATVIALPTFLVRENLRGEIDLYVTPVPVPLLH